MNDDESDSASRALMHDAQRLRNPYLRVIASNRAEELVEFEMETDPYRNFLPGISSVQAARTVGRGLHEGRSGHHVMFAISLLLVAVLVLPALAAVFAQAFH